MTALRYSNYLRYGTIFVRQHRSHRSPIWGPVNAKSKPKLSLTSAAAKYLQLITTLGRLSQEFLETSAMRVWHYNSRNAQNENNNRKRRRLCFWGGVGVFIFLTIPLPENEEDDQRSQHLLKQRQYERRHETTAIGINRKRKRKQTMSVGCHYNL